MEIPMFKLFMVCQLYVCLFIALHDWLPLGRLNNLGGIRAVDSRARRVVVTVLSALPYLTGFLGSLCFAGSRFPDGLQMLLWISYGAGLAGILRAWWLPYLLFPDPVRAQRYQVRFASTHAFLPARNGIRPDTLHVSFHAVFLVTLILFGILTFAADAPIMR